MASLDICSHVYVLSLGDLRTTTVAELTNKQLMTPFVMHLEWQVAVEVPDFEEAVVDSLTSEVEFVESERPMQTRKFELGGQMVRGYYILSEKSRLRCPVRLVDKLV